MADNIVAEGLLNLLRLGDIIEMPQPGFFHYALYLGDGVVVHVTKKGTWKSAVAAERFLSIVERSPASINNFDEKAKQLGLRKRSWSELFSVATNGLEINSDGKVRVGSYSKLQYHLLYNNCEMFATYCKYEYPGGWTEQGMNVWKALTGVISSTVSLFSGNIPNAINATDSVVAKTVLVVGTPIYVAADVAASTLSDAFSPVTSTLQNITRPAGTVDNERDRNSTSYSTPSAIGASAQTSRETKQAHWSVFSVGAESPSAEAGVHAGYDGVQASAKAQFIRGEVGAGPCKVGVGLQADTEVCIRKGRVGASLLGFGGEIGSNGIKIKTPVADASCTVM